LGELGVSLPHPPILHCDNIGAMYLTSNPMFHARIKHIAIDYHFVRDKVDSKILDLRFISGKDQVADILTKPLVSENFTLLKFNLNIRPPQSRLRGCIRPTQTQTSRDNAEDDKHQEEDL
jgi:hypothetical protein